MSVKTAQSLIEERASSLNAMGTGTLKIWNVDRGFGFIKDNAGGRDVFVHATTLRAARIDPETIKLGIRLAYEVETPETQTRAANIWIP
jgi:cold shock protein